MGPNKNITIEVFFILKCLDLIFYDKHVPNETKSNNLQSEVTDFFRQNIELTHYAYLHRNPYRGGAEYSHSIRMDE